MRGEKTFCEQKFLLPSRSPRAPLFTKNFKQQICFSIFEKHICGGYLFQLLQTIFCQAEISSVKSFQNSESVLLISFSKVSLSEILK